MGSFHTLWLLYSFLFLSISLTVLQVVLIEACCVTIAMYCLIQFYLQLRKDLVDHSPFLKILSIKLVIFLSFWQTIIISFLTSGGLIKSTNKFQNPDIKIGIPSMLLCMEMAIFSLLHLWAFSWRPYDVKNSKSLAAENAPGWSGSRADYRGGFLGIKALMEAFNPWDLVKAVGRGARWLLVGHRKRHLDSSYQATRVGTGLGLEPTGNNNLNSGGFPGPGGVTAYGGSGGTGPPGPYMDSGNGKPIRYAGSDVGEGEELLSHAQSNPQSMPPPAYGQYKHSAGAGDIGMATSDFGDDEDRRDNSFDDRLPQNPMPGDRYRGEGGQMGDRYRGDGRGQETGVVGYPHEEPQYGRQEQGQHTQMPTPFFPPPFFPPPAADDTRRTRGR